MRKILLTLYFIVYFINSNAQGVTSDQVILKKLEEKIINSLEEKKIPGLAIAVIHQGKVIHKKGYGYADLSNKIKNSPETGFNIGSISKLFTAYAVMKLVEENSLNLDTPIHHYLNRWQLPKSEYNHDKVTIRGLLNHSAGISVHGYPGFIDKDKLPSLEASLNGVNGPARVNEKVIVSIEPQTKFKYSGGGYTLLQLIIEEVTGISFEKYMEKHIFQKLKMKNTSFNIDERILRNSALPYDENLNPLPIEYFTAKAAAGLHTTLDDFILFAKDTYMNHTVITKESIMLMLSPTKISDQNYGLGFRMLNLGSLRLKGHSGSNTGWQSGFFMDYKENSGLIMMSNGHGADVVLKALLKYWVSLYNNKL